jgi:two-component system, chemotaxis family, chemotaxis protein CheY
MAKILIVDDSGLSRKILRGILESDGHEIIEASDGKTAIQRYSLEQPDLVTLDLMMTGLNGFEVLATLKELDANARVVIATADIQTSTQALTKASGACGLVTKPFQAEQVLDAVHEVLGMPEPVSKEGPTAC